MKPILEQSRPAKSVVDVPREELMRRLRALLRHYPLRAAWLIGSCARGDARPWSDIDLILVCDTDLPFIERPRLFSSLDELGVPVDVLVYTPDEFVAMEAEPTSFWRQARKEGLQLV